MANLREFTVESMPNFKFREAYTSPVDLLALSLQVDFDQFKKTKELFEFALEHCEVKVGEKWFPVKSAGMEAYAPLGIEKNFAALNDICHWYIDTVLMEVFPESAE